jgi:hypothetical protein
MDTAIVSALAAVLGSIVGGAASISTAWLTQRSQSKRETIMSEIRRREQVYGEFIAECSRLAMDALDNTLDKPHTLIQVYAIHHRISLVSTDAVSRASGETIKLIIAQYRLPSQTREQMRQRPDSELYDPLRAFSNACRDELQALHRALS